jgi:pilus assembly protein Flp/PilA
MLTRLLQAARTFLQNEDGPTAVEYAVMLTLIVVACIGTITALGGNASAIFAMVSGDVGNVPASGYAYGQQMSGGSSVSSGYWFSTSANNEGWGYDASTGQAYNYLGNPLGTQAPGVLATSMDGSATGTWTYGGENPPAPGSGFTE